MSTTAAGLANAAIAMNDLISPLLVVLVPAAPVSLPFLRLSPVPDLVLCVSVVRILTSDY